MSANRDVLFEQLLDTKNEEEELLLVLSRMPTKEREAVWAAAVPHWFDASVLTGLLSVSDEEGARLYGVLQSLPFVSPYQGKGSCIHELTRTVLLRLWWTQQRSEFSAMA